MDKHVHDPARTVGAREMVWLIWGGAHRREISVSGRLGRLDLNQDLRIQSPVCCQLHHAPVLGRIAADYITGNSS